MKTRKRIFYPTTPSLKFESDCPLECPHCGAYNMPSFVSNVQLLHEPFTYHLFILQNNCCDQFSQAVYKSQGDIGELLVLLPQSVKTGDFPDSIYSISPRFVALYNQCYEAEQKGHFELAGSGYRNAIEILIKDFAINLLNQPKDDVVKCRLAKVIEDYLPNLQLSQSADVLRVLGNDHTHYDRRFEDIDFQVIKRYMQIFIDSIDCEYLIRNPIVKTNPKLSPKESQ